MGMLKSGPPIPGDPLSPQLRAGPRGRQRSQQLQQEGLPPGLVPRINQTLLTPSHLKNRKVGLQVKGSNFTLEGCPFLILSGTIHYFRVPREYWRDRLLKLKACGFNTVTT
ncbi:Beta-galactosidase-1-like protein 3 [Fukomys damarensis]|uniref:Beta-galactosidase-1-like protein 3 n=1 Tax=Fukomys damarensis TaxID=885580 RepID=A0A091E1W4_FUKDA|nr:Beta-galactosidase-1-like protein 3 [Fukomys damarensis]